MSERLLTDQEIATARFQAGCSSGFDGSDSQIDSICTEVAKAQDAKTRAATLRHVASFLDTKSAVLGRIHWLDEIISTLKRGEEPWEVKA